MSADRIGRDLGWLGSRLYKNVEKGSSVATVIWCVLEIFVFLGCLAQIAIASEQNGWNVLWVVVASMSLAAAASSFVTSRWQHLVLVLKEELEDASSPAGG